MSKKWYIISLTGMEFEIEESSERLGTIDQYYNWHYDGGGTESIIGVNKTKMLSVLLNRFKKEREAMDKSIDKLSVIANEHLEEVKNGNE